jgi:hypothetical protein
MIRIKRINTVFNDNEVKPVLIRIGVPVFSTAAAALALGRPFLFVIFLTKYLPFVV